MTSPSRDVGSMRSLGKTAAREADSGRMYVVVVGIDRYRAWSKLERAVSDARGARDAFLGLGFTELRPPLLDDAATGAALHRLVTDDMRAIGDEDSLVVFFAGHGHTVPEKYSDGTATKRGYLIPFDAEPPSAHGTWVSLESWLHDIAHLRAKHILVVIDACHSGIALNPVIRWRGDVRSSEPLDKLRTRRSRRIITSALDDEQAMDSGPIQGHSLFTGCLIEALTGGFRAQPGQFTATGSEIALHVQRRVSSYPGCKQTPDFGALELDNRGELILALSGTQRDDLLAPPPSSHSQHLGVDGVMPRRFQSAPRQRASDPAVAHSRDRQRTIPPSGVDTVRPKRARTDTPVGATPGGRLTASSAVATAEPANAGSTAVSKRPPVSMANPQVAAPPGAGDVASGSVRSATASLPSRAAIPLVTTHAAAETVSAPTPAQRASPATVAAPSPTTVNLQPGHSTSAPSAIQKPNSRLAHNPIETAFIAALERHHGVRRGKHRVLTLVKADPMTGTSAWARWAASHGLLTLVIEATGLAAVTASLLDQMPWLRVLGAARSRLATAAGLDARAFDGELDARLLSERQAWLDQIAGHDRCARVAAWLVSAIREPLGRVSDLSQAPIQGGDLLAALHELSAPFSVLFHHAEPTSSWLERAVHTAAEFVDFLPHCAVAVSATHELAATVLRRCSDSAALELARKGEVPLAGQMVRVDSDLAETVQQLHAALVRDPRTRGLFEAGVQVPTHDRPVQVDLIARDALLAVEIDDWYRCNDPNARTRDRNKDLCLSRAQFFVMRFLAEDVEDRIEQTVEEIAIGLAGRRASGSFEENSNDK
jgi:very-short-patch-repair endonuclease